MVRNAFTMAEPARRCYPEAFSSEVETGSRQENASNQKPGAPFRFHRNGAPKIPTEGMAMRDETLKEKARITAGAVAALVIVGWLAIIALALMAVL